MKKHTLFSPFLTSMYTMLLFTNCSFAQSDEGYIYGEVHMIDGQTFVGQIRWGEEEAFWDDIFNSSKIKNDFIRYLDRADMRDRREEDRENNRGNRSFKWGDFMSVWVDDAHGIARSHTFACRFGDIDRIEIIGRDEVAVTFRNGEEWELRGGSNDIGRNIKILDQEIGEMDLRWDRIETVDFKPTPKKLSKKMGDPLFGTVLCSKGEYTGFILWDNDEALSTDKLDGSSDNGKMSIEFANIQAIKAGRRGSDITLKSGRELYLYGSNDVNSENRGIVVKNQDMGRVLIDWDEFDNLEFSKAPNTGPSYDDFKNRPLKGNVITLDGEEVSGLLAYDLDESWSWEMLDGDDDGYEYTIPFEKVKSIRPKNFNYSTVTLRNGEELLLGESQDVTERNDGVLIFKEKDDRDPKYVPWRDVDRIVFD